MKSFHLRSLAVILATFSTASIAQTVDWIGANDGDWFTPGNWNPAGVPISTEDVVIDNGTNVLLTDPGAISDQIVIGETGGTGSLTVRGGGQVTVQNYITVGEGDTGTLIVEDGGRVSTIQLLGGNGAGSIFVRGAGSELQVAALRNLAWSAAGNTLNVSDGGAAIFDDGLALTHTASSIGAVNLDGTSGARGVLTTPFLEEGVGEGTIDFNGGTLRASQNETDFLRDFETGEVTIGPGGAFIDSNGFSVTIGTILDGAGALNKIGTGTLTLSAANLYSGGTVLTAGTLSVSAVNNLGPSGGITFEGGTLQTTAGFTLNRAITVNAGGGTINVAAGSLIHSSTITGANALNKTGTGTLTLNGNNNAFSGGVTLSQGLLEVGHNNALGTGTFTANGGTLSTNGSAKAVNNNIVVGGDFSIYPRGTLINISSFRFNGNVDLGNAFRTITNPSVFSNGDFGEVRFDGVFSNGGVFFNSNGTSDLAAFTLRGTQANTYTGLTRLGYGVSVQLLKTAGVTAVPGNVQIDNNGVLVVDSNEQIVNSSTITVNGIGRLQIGANNDVTETIGSLMGNGEVALKDSDAGSSILIQDGTFTGEITGGVATNAASLRKIGTGTLTLSGDSTYVGGTQIDAGTLVVDGSLGDTDVTLGAAGFLQGIGTIHGSITSNGTIAPGNSPGVLTVGELILTGTSVLDFELGTSSDRIDVVANSGGLGSSGNLTLDGTMNITNSGGFGVGTYRLFNYDGGLTDSGLGFGIAPGGFDLTVDIATGGEVNLNVVAVEEQFWDGSDETGGDGIGGGSGTWNASNTNWTNSTGSTNGDWAGLGAVFSVAPGTVTVDDDVEFRFLRFTVDGYELVPGTGSLIAVDNTAIIADPGVIADIGAAISGDTVEIRGGGRVILSGLNTYSGGTLLSEGAVQIDSNDALGTGDFFVQNGTTIATSTGFDIVNRTVLNGNITLDADPGATFSGEVDLGNGSRTIDLNGSMNFAGTIVGGADSSLTLNSADDSVVLITGGLNNSFGSLRIGANVEALLAKDPGAIGISGDLRIDAGGELDVIYDGTVSPIAPGANVRLDGRLDFEGGNALDVTFASLTGSGELCNDCNPSPLNLTILSGNFSGQIYDRDEFDVGGTLTLIKDGDGTLTLSGINNYSGPTLVNGGTLIAASDTAISNTAVTVDGDGSILRINEDVSLSNALALDNGGELEAFGTYNGTVAVLSNGGTVSVMKGGKINGSINSAGDADVNLFSGGHISGDINFGNHFSVLNLTGSDDDKLSTALGGRIAGTYALLKSGTSSWAIDRKVTPRGTLIAEGSLVLIGKGDLGGEIINEGVFVFAKRGEGDYTFDGEISGSGIVVQNGDANTTILGKQTYIGATYVDSGGLILGDGKVESSLAGDVIVNKDAFFGGTGTIGGSFTLAGTLNPGYSPGNLAINGNFTLRSTALLVIEVDSAKSFDRIVVGGKAKLGGTLRVVLGNDFTPETGQEFDILNAKSLSGTFAKVDGLDLWELVYGPNSFSLVFGGREPYQSYANTPNQFNVAVALEKLRTEDFDKSTDFERNVRPVLDALAPAELRQAFEAIIPNQSVAFSDTLFARSRSWMPQMQTRLADIRAGSRGFAASGFNQMGAADMKDVLAPVLENKWGVWVDGSGVFSQVAGFDGLRTGDASTAAGTVGVDYRLSDNFTVGLYTGYIGSWTNFGGNSEVDSNGTRFGMYSTYQSGGFYLNNLIGGEWNSYDWSRGINFPGLNRTANADTEGTVFETMFGGGYDWKVCNWATVGAFTSLEYTLLFVDGFTEKGAGALNLRVNDQDADSLRTNVGLQFAGDIPIGQRSLRPSLRAAWRHEYLDGNRRINSALVGGAGPGFSTLLPGAGRKDSMLLNGGFSMDLTDDVMGYLYYTGDLAGGETDSIHSVNAGLRVAF